MNVYQKLQAARVKLQNTQLKKSGHNKFAGYQYFELGDFLPIVQNIFVELGLCGVVSFDKDIATLNIVDAEVGYKESDDGRLFLPPTICFTSPMGSAALKGCHEVQNIGAVETYQRRYLWVTAMEIVEHDALDAITDKEKPSYAKSVSKSVFDELPVDSQNELRNMAMDVISFLTKSENGEAFDCVESFGLDADSKTALWSLFDSKQRAALKAESAARRVTQHA